MSKSTEREGKTEAEPGRDVVVNKAARYRYEIVETFEAGIVLRGTEVKALREGNARLADSYAAIEEGELILRGAYIPPYAPAARENHEPERPRKLLLHRREIERILGRISEKGLTIVPTRIYFKDGRAKVEIALARGKDRFDKRQSIKEREMKRDLDRAMSER